MREATVIMRLDLVTVCHLDLGRQALLIKKLNFSHEFG